AIALHAAVAATFAHEFIDDHAHGGIDQRAALATAPLFGGAGLVVNDDRRALEFSERTLDAIEFIAMFDGDARWQTRDADVFFRLVGHDGDFCRALGAHAQRDLQ